jgi:hypothetical protein
MVERQQTDAVTALQIVTPNDCAMALACTVGDRMLGDRVKSMEMPAEES